MKRCNTGSCTINSQWIENEVERLMNFIDFQGCNIGSVRQTIKNIVINTIQLQKMRSMEDIDIETMVIRLIKGLPVTPLTGEAGEWECSEFSNFPAGVEVNKRYKNVIRYDEKNSRAYDLYGKVFTYDHKRFFTRDESKIKIEFPYEVPMEPEVIELTEQPFDTLFGRTEFTDLTPNEDPINKVLHYGLLDGGSEFVSTEEFLNSLYIERDDHYEKLQDDHFLRNKKPIAVDWNLLMVNDKFGNPRTVLVPNKPIIKDISRSQLDKLHCDAGRLKYLHTHDSDMYEVKLLPTTMGPEVATSSILEHLFLNFNLMNDRDDYKAWMEHDDGEHYFLDINKGNVLNTKGTSLEKYDYLPIIIY